MALAGGGSGGGVSVLGECLGHWRGSGSAEVVALPVGDADRAQRGELVLGFDALGD